MNVLITGANGQLGSEIKRLKDSYKKLNFVFTGIAELDICDLNSVEKFVNKHNISAIINCAAYTAVDKAESEESLATQINALGVQNLVKAIQAVGGKIIQISTDYVFDGNHFLPYKEAEQVSPIGVYGQTKYRGEQAVLDSKVDGVIVRTSWLYSSYGNNFVKTMLKLGKEKDQLGVVFDQVGTPTYAKDLAKACLDILSQNKVLSQKGKVYHFSNEGVASWYDFATAIMELGNRNCKIIPIETIDYPTPAKRPFYTVLNKKKIRVDFKVEVPYWRDSLKKCIKKLETKIE